MAEVLCYNFVVNNSVKEQKMSEMNEDIVDVPPVVKPPVNLTRSSTQQLKDTPITANNVDSVTRELLKRDDQVMLKINSTERDKSAVFVGIGGRGYNIPRNIWVKVPKAVLGILDNAKIREYRVNADPKRHENASITPQEVNRFAVSSKPMETPVAPLPTAPAEAKHTVK